MRGLLKLAVVLIVAVVMIVALIGYFVARSKRLDPVAVVRDTLTGYEAGSDRHRLAASLDQRWDPIGDANARIESLAEFDRAYPLLAEAAARLELADHPIGPLVRPGEEDWERAAAWVASVEGRQVVHLVRRASSCPKLGMQLSDEDDAVLHAARAAQGLDVGPLTSGNASPSPIMVLLPQVSMVRHGVRLLCVDAHLARAAGDRDRFVENLVSALQLVDLRTDLNALIEQIVGYAVVVDVASVIQDTITEDPGFLNETASAKIEAALELVSQNEIYQISAESETLAFEDIVRRLVDGKGVFVPANIKPVMSGINDGGTMPPPSSVRAESINAELLAILQQIDSWGHEATSAASMPWHPMGDIDAELEALKSESAGVPGRTGRLLAGILTPAWNRGVATNRRAHSEFIAIRIALAAHRHHLRHGQPPASLDAIDADLLTFDPVDGFTGGRLVYRWTDAGHLVYAAGPDGDDDGGRPIEPPADGEWGRGISDQLLEAKPDGDYILFPPQD